MKRARTIPLFLFAIAAVAIAWTTPSSAIVIRDDANEEASSERAAKYLPLLAWLKVKDPRGLILAEGTLINPEWVITAAHVVDELVPGSKAIIDGNAHAFLEVCIHPAWSGVFEELNDIALVRLSLPAASGADVVLSRDEIAPGQPVVLVGRGMSGNGLTGPTTDSRRLRAATNTIDSVGPLHVAFVFDAPRSEMATELEGVSGPGDSGGPLFLDQPGRPVLIGISSAQDDAPTQGIAGTYGVIEYYTRVAHFVDWIDAVTSDSERSACAKAP